MPLDYADRSAPLQGHHDVLTCASHRWPIRLSQAPRAARLKNVPAQQPGLQTGGRDSAGRGDLGSAPRSAKRPNQQETPGTTPIRIILLATGQWGRILG